LQLELETVRRRRHDHLVEGDLAALADLVDRYDEALLRQLQVRIDVA
jgi:hypothetical protein